MTAAAPGGRVPRLSEREFLRWQALVQREAGIFLAPAKAALLESRLSRRVRELGLPDLAAYLDRVEADPAERVRCLDLVTTNETRFFREPRQWELLEARLFPRLAAEAAAGRRPRRVRAWSAACSSGEEPWSLAMSLAAAFPASDGWEVEVLATDLSTRMLARAREGVYPLARARDVPRPLLHAFMLRGTGGSEGFAKVGPEVRPLVRFARLNLVDEGWPGLGTFDLLLCRNVLMYFAPATRARVLGRLLGHLAPDGALFLGHAESLLGTALPVVPLAPAVYVRADGPHAPARRPPASPPPRPRRGEREG